MGFWGLAIYVEMVELTPLRRREGSIPLMRRWGFLVWRGGSGDYNVDCYYKRFTPVLTQADKNQSDLCFYKVNHSNSFIAFADSQRKTGGFARDLFIDYIRWNYYKGSIAYLNPREIGLNQFPAKNIFPELFQAYQDKIISTYNITKIYIEQILKSKTQKWLQKKQFLS